MEPENPVEYWRKRSRQALESQGVVLPPPPPPSLLASPSSSLLRRLPSWRPPQKRVVMNVRRRIERIGLDLICNACQHHIPKSQRLDILCHFYSPHPHDPPESKLTRCYVRCPNCSDIIELGRNLGDPNNFVVFAGATQRFPAVDIVLDSDPNLQNEAYPDALLDSPDDLRRRVVAYKEGELQLSRTDSDLRGIQGRNETMTRTSPIFTPTRRPMSTWRFSSTRARVT